MRTTYSLASAGSLAAGVVLYLVLVGMTASFTEIRLIEDGVRWLDLGGVATDRSPGIARFKLGMGGEVAILPGTFLVRGSRYDRPGS